MSKKINLGIVAHVDAGKTTLSEALLYCTGQIRELGRVDHKDTFLDTNHLERERGITIFAKTARLKFDDTDYVLLDTPGHVDFSAETERTLSALDYCVLVISGTDGVQAHTRTLWRLLNSYHVPVFLFVNKMDLAGADKARVLTQLKKMLSSSCIDFTGAELGITTTDIADGAGLDEERMEEVALCREDLMEQYLEEGTIPMDEVRALIADRHLFPVLFGSALKLDHVENLLHALNTYTVEPKYPPNPAAKVIKIGRDEKGARLTYMKITGGTFRGRQLLTYSVPKEELTENDIPAGLAGDALSGNSAGAAVDFLDASLDEGDDGADSEVLQEKIDQIRLYSGDSYTQVPEAVAGDIVAVTGLTKTMPGMGLGAEQPITEPILEPVLSYKIELPAGTHALKFYSQIKSLEEEDPQLHIKWNAEHKEIRVQLMGQVQTEVLASLVKERFGVDISFGPGSIVYKETIKAPIEGVGHFEPLRHYAEVHLLLEPGERGSGITVKSGCSTDILDSHWQRLIMSHVLERRFIPGVLTRSALTDIKVTLLTGRANPKHTVGGDFRQATYRAIRHALMKTECELLEPYYAFALEVPRESIGRAMNDLQLMNGKFDQPEIFSDGMGERARFLGTAPVVCLADYAKDVHAYTKGTGVLSLAVAGYDTCHNADEVIDSRAYDPENDLRNPTGSVFCAHGAGYYVPWNEVEYHMHLEYAWNPDAEATPVKEVQAPVNQEAIRRAQCSNEGEVANIDAELAEMYAREHGGHDTKSEGWQKQKRRDSIVSGASHVKYDKKGQPIYPKKDVREPYMIIDGYNTIHAWPELARLLEANADAAIAALCEKLENLQGFLGIRMTVVFDAYRRKNNPGKSQMQGNLEVVYTKQDELADAYIERTVHDNVSKYLITVVTNDGMEQMTVLSMGGLRMTVQELINKVEEHRLA